jgi:hypothetical protein
MVTATIGTVALLAVVATSVVIVKRRLRYEWWYAVHLLAYAGIALAWFHQIPTGNELVLDQPDDRDAVGEQKREDSRGPGGPPGFTDLTRRNLLRAGVPRRRIHTERFAP